MRAVAFGVETIAIDQACIVCYDSANEARGVLFEVSSIPNLVKVTAMPIKNWTPERLKRQAEISRKWYQDHTELAKTQKTLRQQELREWLEEYKSHLRCQQCGESRLPTLDFHHRNPVEKDRAITEAIHRGWSVERILQEIEKCDVLCANCHRKLHRSQSAS